MMRAAVVVACFLVASIFAVGVSVTDPTAAQAAGGGYVEKCGGGEIFLNEKEERTFVLHNEIRIKHELPTFCVHPMLQEAARAHSKDMLRRDYFSHNTKGRGSFGKRLQRFGYDADGYAHYRAGENIAYGSGPYGEPDNRMRAWMKSEGHRHNILNDEFREIGVGTETGDYKGFNGVTMYTVDFGVRRR
jgi:uncharacterized protein YkwD